MRLFERLNGELTVLGFIAVALYIMYFVGLFGWDWTEDKKGADYYFDHLAGYQYPVDYKDGSFVNSAYAGYANATTSL